MFSHQKYHLAVLTIESYDIELTNIKISDKNIVSGWCPDPRRGIIFTTILKFCWFRCKMLSQQKKIQLQNVLVYGNKHSLTRKIGFRVISSFVIDGTASKILIFFCKILYIVFHYGFLKKFKMLKFSLS